MQRKSMNILKKMIPDRLREKILEFNWNMSVKRRLTKLYFRLMFSSMRGNLKDYKKEIHYIAKHGISCFHILLAGNMLILKAKLHLIIKKKNIMRFTEEKNCISLKE